MNLRVSFSGGGFRATFYCLGAFRRLVELGLHDKVTHINSVSGGSFLAAQIMCALCKGPFDSIKDFDEKVTEPLIFLGQSQLRKRILKKAIYPAFPRSRFSQVLPTILDELNFQNRRLIELPDKPEWSAHATCLNTGKRFRFKQRNMGGNQIGVTKEIRDIKVSFAVACSAAFPMMFAPHKISTKGRKFYDKWWSDTPSLIDDDKLPETLYLSDGGVYDNLGSESIIKGSNPFIIFDASGFLQHWETNKKISWFSLYHRPLDAGLEQVVLLRRRLLFKESEKTYGFQLLLRDPVQKIIKNPEEYGKLSGKIFDLPKYNLLSIEVQNLLSQIRTDLDGFHDVEIKCLLWAGAIKADIVMKRYMKDIIPERLVDTVPLTPSFKEKEIKKLLKKGIRRSLLRELHTNLHKY
jgi:NTE family protein